MSDIFSPNATASELRKLQDLPPEQGGIGVVAKEGDVGVIASGSKQLGKGWSLSGAFTYMKESSYTAAAWLGWKGKS